MAVRTDVLRRVTTRAPIPGRILRRLLNRYDTLLTYPSSPQIVRSPLSRSCFEIRELREYVQRNIYFLGYYEIRESKFVRSILRPGDTFVDLGANIGWFTLLAARAVGPSGAVVAFEPSTRIFEHLLTNIALNGYKNVAANRLALSDRPGFASLTGATARNAGTGTIIAPDSRSKSAEKVPTVAFDHYWRESGFLPIRLMKIDVEGAEELVLSGLRDVLHHRICDYFLIEVSERTARNVAEILTDSGYAARAVGVRGPQPITPSQMLKERNVLFALRP